MTTSKQIEELLKQRFVKYLKTLKEISRPSRKKPGFIQNEKQLFYKYDDIVQYELYSHASLRPAAPDTVIFNKGGLVFIEFKSGNLDQIMKDKKQIKLKAIEGCFVVLARMRAMYGGKFDLAGLMAMKKSYLIVYDSAVDPEIKLSRRPGFIAMGEYLKIFEGVFFEKVQVMSSDVFLEVLDHMEGKAVT